jgi:hypothetical protein
VFIVGRPLRQIHTIRHQTGRQCDRLSLRPELHADGRVFGGMAPDPLPHIALRVEGDRVYVRGTTETI